MTINNNPNPINNYIDGFVFPMPQKHLSAYQAVAQKVAAIWQEHFLFLVYLLFNLIGNNN